MRLGAPYYDYRRLLPEFYRFPGQILLLLPAHLGDWAFPTANACSTEDVDDWPTRIETDLSNPLDAPYCPNLIFRGPWTPDDLSCLLRHLVEMVITSVGLPAELSAHSMTSDERFLGISEASVTPR